MQIHLLEPWWNPAAEAQAMDRVHRLGQRRTVNVWRYICADSIEERILTIQARLSLEKNAKDIFCSRVRATKRASGSMNWIVTVTVCIATRDMNSALHLKHTKVFLPLVISSTLQHETQNKNPFLVVATGAEEGARIRCI